MHLRSGEGRGGALFHANTHAHARTHACTHVTHARTLILCSSMGPSLALMSLQKSSSTCGTPPKYLRAELMRGNVEMGGNGVVGVGGRSGWEEQGLMRAGGTSAAAGSRAYCNHCQLGEATVQQTADRLQATIANGRQTASDSSQWATDCKRLCSQQTAGLCSQPGAHASCGELTL